MFVRNLTLHVDQSHYGVHKTPAPSPTRQESQSKTVLSYHTVQKISLFFVFFFEKFTFACSVGCWNCDYAEFQNCSPTLYDTDIPFLNP